MKEAKKGQIMVIAYFPLSGGDPIISELPEASVMGNQQRGGEQELPLLGGVSSWTETTVTFPFQSSGC